MFARARRGAMQVGPAGGPAPSGVPCEQEARMVAADVRALLTPSAEDVRFDGVGAVSGGGGGTRLLLDYEPAIRSAILDLLFKPQYGASLHTLKVEIGCDGNSGMGPEASHQRSAHADFDERGYEIWLMAEARKRNAGIHLSGLEWGVPAWVADRRGRAFTQRNSDYLVSWLHGLSARNLTIDSLGVGLNEEYYNASWITQLRARLTAEGMGELMFVAADLCCGREYSIVSEMQRDAALRESIDVVGTHCPGPLNGQPAPNATMRRLGKPFWNSEQHFGVPDPNPVRASEWAAAVGLAQTLNTNYVTAFHTSTLMWTIAYSWYDWIWYAGKGLVTANSPWSGAWSATDSLWALAHTTQFVQPGWRFLGGRFGCARTPPRTAPCGLLGGEGAGSARGSWVSYRSADSRDLTLVIETFGATNSTRFALTLGGRLRAVRALNVWTTRQGRVFARRGSITLAGATLDVAVPPDELWTLTSLDGGTKGGGERGGEAARSPSDPLPLPHRDDFDSYRVGSQPKFFADLNGAFAVDADPTRASNARGARRVLMQQITRPPIATHSGRAKKFFATAIGDSSWANYTVTLDARALGPADAAVLFVGSHAGAFNIDTSRIFDQLATDGFTLVLYASSNTTPWWELRYDGRAVVTGLGLVWRPDRWSRLALSVCPTSSSTAEVSASVDGVWLVSAMRFALTAGRPLQGAAFFGCGHHQAAYDNFSATYN